MPINQDCPLLLHDLYSYDIRSAYPTIMGTMNWDFKDTDLDNKSERNIVIGKAQIGNENLSGFLMNSADQLVNFYLEESDIKENDIIITQRDGFILKSILNNIDEFIKMEFRGFIDFLVLSVDRTMYLAVTDDGIDVKGVPLRYDALDPIYEKFEHLNFLNKKALFSQLGNIKKSIMESEDKKLFLIPRDTKFAIVTKTMGTLEVPNDTVFSIDDVNRERYYAHYFKPFLESIFLESY